MRISPLSLFLAALFCAPAGLRGQDKNLVVPDLPEFLARYAQGLKPLDKLYAELAEEKLSLRDERGQPLGRRRIEDRQQALDDLRKTVQQLMDSPQDLVLALRLLFQSEAQSDDLFDLSQVAYDNNKEELGKSLSDQLKVMDHHNAELESYVLSVAAERQERLRELEKENQDLQQKLREATEQPKAKTSSMLAAPDAVGIIPCATCVSGQPS